MKSIASKYFNNPILDDIPPNIPGWEKLYDSLLVELMVYLEKEELEIKIAQIKSKFGQLRVYVKWHDSDHKSPIPTEVYNIIKKYEHMSLKICKICGNKKLESVHDSKITYECMEHYGDRRA